MRVPLIPLALLVGLSLGLGTAATGCTKSSTPAAKTTGGNGQKANAKAGGPAAEEADDSPIAFVEPTPKACMLHAEADGYFQCLTGTGGQCFHFGASCAPAALCMYEQKSKLHKTCTSEQQGKCETYGSTCTPKDACMYEAASQRYRKCEAAKGGACSKFGEACLPAA